MVSPVINNNFFSIPELDHDIFFFLIFTDGINGHPNVIVFLLPGSAAFLLDAV